MNKCEIWNWVKNNNHYVNENITLEFIMFWQFTLKNCYPVPDFCRQMTQGRSSTPWDMSRPWASWLLPSRVKLPPWTWHSYGLASRVLWGAQRGSRWCQGLGTLRRPAWRCMGPRRWCTKAVCISICMHDNYTSSLLCEMHVILNKLAGTLCKQGGEETAYMAGTCSEHVGLSG